MKKTVFSKGFIYLVLILGAMFILLPFGWMVSTSLKAPDEVLIMPPKWIPDNPMWENFKVVLASAPFKRYFINSVFVTTMITLGELFTTILAAFAFSRIKFKGREVIFSVLLGTMMVPSEVLIIPNYVTLCQLGWIDKYKALIIPWCASVFAIFLLRQYFLGIPEELYDAAKIDGCSDFRYLWTIMVPLAKPAIVTIALLKIINSWNAFMWPLIVTNSESMRTLPVALSAFSSDVGTDYHLLMAAAVMITLPMIILYIILQKHIIQGISKSGIKG